MTERSVQGKAERLGFRLVHSVYGGYAIVDQNNAIVAPAEAWRSLSLDAADRWLNDYISGSIT